MALLNLSWVYDLYQTMVGARRQFRLLVKDHIRPEPDLRMVDIGCGTASIVDWLGEVDYLGIDMSERYIAKARKRYDGRAEFFVATTEYLAHQQPQTFDIALALGVLHHLDDNLVEDLFRDTSRLLRPGGRMVTVDPCYVDGQSSIARFLIDNDRGKNVRDPGRYRELAMPYFENIDAQVRHDLLHVPYTQYVMECSQQEGHRG